MTSGLVGMGRSSRGRVAAGYWNANSGNHPSSTSAKDKNTDNNRGKFPRHTYSTFLGLGYQVEGQVLRYVGYLFGNQPQESGDYIFETRNPPDPCHTHEIPEQESKKKTSAKAAHQALFALAGKRTSENLGPLRDRWLNQDLKYNSVNSYPDIFGPLVGLDVLGLMRIGLIHAPFNSPHLRIQK